MSEALGRGDVLVVKIGSTTLVDERFRVDAGFLRSICDQVATLVAEGVRVVIVSSGAVAAGLDQLGFEERPSDIASLQACAAAGQAALTGAYGEVLAEHGIACGQVLLTRRDVVDREGYLNARTTLTTLLSLGAVPVVNENDTVSVAEFAFGDNDTLGAIVATLVGAKLYVILSDVDGLYTANPQDDPTATLISRVEQIDSEVVGMAGGSGSAFGTGGMSTKIHAARATLAAGIPCVICRGRSEGALVAVAHGEAVGTRFVPQAGAHEESRKLWIGLAEIPQGSITLDAGACRAVLQKGASVLPVGITKVSGEFAEGDVIDVIAPDGTLVGRGTARFGSEDMTRIRGLKLDVIERFLPDKAGSPAIHRDELLVF